VPAAASLPVGDTKNARPASAAAAGAAAPMVAATAAAIASAAHVLREYERIRGIRAE
jgi:hypothetical protein